MSEEKDAPHMVEKILAVLGVGILAVIMLYLVFIAVHYIVTGGLPVAKQLHV